MHDVIEDMYARWEVGVAVAVGTVVATFSSAQRSAGAAMTVAEDGTVIGSVSGGCVEAAVYELGQRVLADGIPLSQRYGVSDDDALAIGLTCGGILDVFVERISPEAYLELGEVVESVRAQHPVAIATVIEHPDTASVGGRLVIWRDRTVGSFGSARIDDAVTDDARGMLASGRTGTLYYGPKGERRGEGMSVFVNSFESPPRMLVVGAIDFAQAMTRMAAFLGYTVTVCDARPVFVTTSRFPEADEVIVDWPHRYLSADVAAGRVDERTAVAVLTHDTKFDVPVLEVALRSKLGYIGAVGSRRTHERGLQRLREAGLTDSELDGLASPIGWTSVRAPPRRPRCRSQPRSSRCTGVVTAKVCPKRRAPYTGKCG